MYIVKTDYFPTTFISEHFLSQSVIFKSVRASVRILSREVVIPAYFLTSKHL